MDKIVNSVIFLLFVWGASEAAESLFFQIEKTAIERIAKGLSKSEPFAQQLTGYKLPF